MTFNVYVQTMLKNTCRHLCLYTRLSIFIHTDILVLQLVSEFVVVVMYLSGGQYQPLLTTVGIPMKLEIKNLPMVHILSNVCYST